MPLLYIAKDLRSIQVPSYGDPDPLPIIWTTFADSPQSVIPVYHLTPILYAALELQTDAIDAAVTAGRLTDADKINRAVERLARIRSFANQWIDLNYVAEARKVLAGRPDALAWVISKYVERMGTEDVVKELERAARRDPWNDGATTTDADETRQDNDKSGQPSAKATSEAATVAV